MKRLHQYILCAIVFFTSICRGQELKIIKFKVNDEQKDSLYQITSNINYLKYRQNHIYIEYQEKGAANYQIRLLGFEKNWQNVGYQTYANYINLLGGVYEFQVRNAQFPARIASIKFHIEEAVWQRSWFIPAVIGYILLLAGIIFYFFQRNRFRQQTRLQQVRNDISADLHDDIGSTLSNISFLTEIAKSRIKDKPQEVPIILDKILEDSKEMVQTMRGMIWTINPTNDRAIDFFRKVENLVKEMLSPHQITMGYDIKIADKQRLSLELQRNLFLVFKEATHNIIKYAKANQVQIIIRKEGNWLMIQIKDDGVGFDQTEETEGNGLRNMRNRIEQVGGNFEIKIDNGTKIRIVVPVPFNEEFF